MTLEQRVEALEEVVKVLVGGEFTVNGGEVFINDVLIQPGSIKAAPDLAAALKKSSKEAAIHLVKVKEIK